MSKIKVLVCDNISQEGLKPLKEDAQFELHEKGKLSETELLEIISEYEGILLRSGTKITKKIIEKADKLKIIGRAGVGIDNIDLKSATEKGILVINAPSGNTIAACEHTIALIFALARKIPEAHFSMKEGKWEKKKFVGIELAGKTAGIIGLGKIGFEVAKRLKSFGMKISVYDPYVDERILNEYGFEKVELDELLKKSDVITIHVPKTKDTINLLNYDNMKMMKKTAFLINCARGGIVNEKDLVRVLKEEKIAGAAVDVFEKEPLENEELRNAPNIILTPHLGASTVEAQEKVAMSVAEDLKKFFSGTIPPSSCNFIYPKDTTAEYRDYLALSEYLGSFLSQITDDFNRIKITYGGEISNWQTHPLKAGVLKGIFKNILDENVNLINAPEIAKKRDILCEDFENPHMEVYSKYIEIATKKFSLKGTIIAKKPHLVEFNEYEVDIVLDGIILLFKNRDVPGVIGRVGTILGEAKINVASMDVARKEKGKSAFTILKLDQKPTPSLLKNIAKLDVISDVKLAILSP